MKWTPINVSLKQNKRQIKQFMSEKSEENAKKNPFARPGRPG